MLKRTLSAIIALALLFTLSHTLAFAADEETDISSFSYSVLENGTAEITSYTGNDATVKIPAEIDGYKVTSIGKAARNASLHRP